MTADTTGSQALSPETALAVPDRIDVPRTAASTPHTSTLGLGWPAVVCEPGLGASSAGWSQVRDGVAAITRVVTYDRRGLGGSPAGAGRRDLTALATDLVDVIRHGCADGPVVLVGHSLGATLARHLAATRPGLVAGLVLIDPIPDRWVLRHARWAAPFGQAAFLAMAGLAHLGLIDVAMALPVLSGVTRSSTSPLAALTEEDRAALAEEMRRPSSHSTSRREFTGLLRSRAELRHLAANPVAPVPLTVISGGRIHRLAAPLRRDATDWHAGLVHAGRDGRHIVVGDGCHSIPRYRPDLVVDAVAELLHRVRAARGRADRVQRTAR